MSADCTGVPHPSRIDQNGFLLQEAITDDEVHILWRGEPFEKDLGDAGKPRCYPEVQIDDWVLRDGDLVYCTPPAKGDTSWRSAWWRVFLARSDTRTHVKRPLQHPGAPV